MTIELHPEYLTKNGKKEFVVLPYEEFQALQELLEDLEDLIDLRNAKQEEADQPSISLAEVKKQLGFESKIDNQIQQEINKRITTL